jgi:hypothetical protein
MLKTVIVILILFILASAASAQKVYILGGENRDIFLGCITCTLFHDESIWNKNGIYGTPNNDLSIWSEFSEYGNEFSNYSPWNEFASRPPALYDDEGNFYGYFTRNVYYKERTEDRFFIYVLDNFRWIMKNFDEYVDTLYF